MDDVGRDRLLLPWDRLIDVYLLYSSPCRLKIFEKKKKNSKVYNTCGSCVVKNVSSS